MEAIRPAGIHDLNRLTDIYNQAIEARFATAHLDRMNHNERKAWLESHLEEPYPLFVYDDGLVKGYCSLSPYRAGRQAFSGTAEISYYVDYHFHQQGIATKLLHKTTQYAKGKGIHTLLAFLFAKNTVSIAFLKKNLFTEWGRLPDAASVDGTSCDHVIYGKKLQIDHQTE